MPCEGLYYQRDTLEIHLWTRPSDFLLGWFKLGGFPPTGSVTTPRRGPRLNKRERLAEQYDTPLLASWRQMPASATPPSLL